MTFKRLSTILMVLALSVSFQVKAEWKLADNYKKSDKTQIYLAAALDAFTAANSELETLGQPLLYCQPASLNLEADKAVYIFEQERAFRMSTGSRNSPFWKEVSLEYVLLWGLQRTFPCE